MTRLFKFIEGSMIGLYNCSSFILCCLIVDFPFGFNSQVFYPSRRWLVYVYGRVQSFDQVALMPAFSLAHVQGRLPQNWCVLPNLDLSVAIWTYPLPWCSQCVVTKVHYGLCSCCDHWSMCLIGLASLMYALAVLILLLTGCEGFESVIESV